MFVTLFFAFFKLKYSPLKIIVLIKIGTNLNSIILIFPSFFNRSYSSVMVTNKVKVIKKITLIKTIKKISIIYYL